MEQINIDIGDATKFSDHSYAEKIARANNIADKEWSYTAVRILSARLSVVRVNDERGWFLGYL